MDEITTLTDLVAYRARRTPSRTAVLFQGRARTFEDLEWEITGFGAHLREQGVSPGDRVVLAIPNSLEFFRVFYGIQILGAVAVPVFPRFGPEKILRIADLCGATAVVVPAAAPRPVVETCRRLAADRFTLVLDSETAAPRPIASFPRVRPHDLAYLQYTSGSTGNPKGVKLAHGALIRNVRQLTDAMRFTEHDRFVSWLPVYHDLGLVILSIVPFYHGAQLILLPTDLSRPHLWLEAIQRSGGTFTAAPDFAFRVCLRHVENPGSYDLSSLRLILNTAEPIRAGTIRCFESAFGLTNVMLPGYGLAEAVCGVATWELGREILVDGHGHVAVGRPFEGIEVRILNNGAATDPGEVGEIWIRSAAACDGYFGNPEASRALFSREGFLNSGDLGYLDADGYLYVTGRKKNILKVGGRTVPNQEIEELVDRHPEVRYSACLGIDHGGPEGEQIHILAEVRSETAGRVEAMRRIVIDIVREHHEQLGLRPACVLLLRGKSIPRTYNGKIQHFLLKRSYVTGELRERGQILFPPD